MQDQPAARDQGIQDRLMNIKTFDLNLLRVFAALEQERHVSRAAQVLGLTQPAISNALQRLRHQCNDPLFVRAGRVMEPTALALAMKEPIHQALKLMETCLTLSTVFDTGSSEHAFKVAMSDVGETVLLPTLTARLMAIAPNVRMSALRLPATDYPDALRTGAIDLAIGNLKLPESGFFQQQLFSDRYVCIAGEKSQLVGNTLSADDYFSLAHVVATGGNAETVVQHYLATQRQARNVRLSVVHYHMAASVVKETNLIATVPEYAATGHSGIRILPLPFQLPHAQVRQFWHRRAHLEPANRWLRQTISELVASQGRQRIQ